jgi:hypothetical protein
MALCDRQAPDWRQRVSDNNRMKRWELVASSYASEANITVTGSRFLIWFTKDGPHINPPASGDR